MPGIVQHLDIAADTQEQLALAIRLVLVWHGAVEAFAKDEQALKFYRFAKPELKAFPGGLKVESHDLLARWVYAWLRDDVGEAAWRKLRPSWGDVHCSKGWRIIANAASAEAFSVTPMWIEYHK